MKKNRRNIAIIAVIAGMLLGGSGLLGESGGAFIGLCALTVAINWLILYSATHSATGKKPEGRAKVVAILSTLQLSIPICALFWWALGSLVWPDNVAFRFVTLALAFPCLLTLPARKKLFSVDGVAFNIKLPGVNPIIVPIIVVGIIIGGIIYVVFR